MKGEKLLMSLPVPTRPSLNVADYITEQRKNWDGKYYTVQKRNYGYTANIRKDTGTKVLELSIFRPSDKQILCRYFLDRASWAGQIYDDNGRAKRTEATIAHLLDFTYRGNMLTTPKSKKAIFNFLQIKDFLEMSEKHVLALIGKYQQNIQAKKLRERRDRIYAGIDKAMECIEPLPADIYPWIHETVMDKSRYIFYQYEKGHRELAGYCTSCREHILIEKPLHNKKAFCPVCGAAAISKATGRCKNGFTDCSRFIYIQKTTNGYAVRLFDVKKRYENIYADTDVGNGCELLYTVDCEIELKLPETARELRDISSRQSMLYEWEDLFKEGMRWGKPKERELKAYSSSFLDTHTFYDMKNLVLGTPGQYFPYDEYLPYYGVLSVLPAITGNAALEYFHKMGLKKLVNQKIERHYITGGVNYDGKNIREVLGIEKHDIPFLIQADPSHDELKLFQNMRKNRERDVDKLFMSIRKASISADLLSQVTEHVTVAKALGYAKKQTEKAKKIKKYSRYSNENYVMTEWRDYLADCAEMGYDLTNEFVVFPKNLAKAHDDTHTLVEQQKSNKLYPNIPKLHKKLMKKFFFEYEGLLIRPPVDGGEITTEGHKLHHCVLRYANDMNIGSTVILFIRKASKPDKSFYTLEISPDGKYIRQCRGLRNCNTTKEVEAFLEKWKVDKLGIKPPKPKTEIEVRIPVAIAG